MAVLKKGVRVTGDERAKWAVKFKKAYEKGKSIREIASKHNRSYGFVHTLLKQDAQVTLRGRGGATRTKGKAPKMATR